MVQIAKESIGTKGARLTSHISLPGRSLVLMPTESHVGVSRRIGGEQERKRLQEIIHRIRPEGQGVIIRTEAEDCTEEELAADMTYLTRLWDRIRRDYDAVAAPALIHADLDVVLKAVRDLFTSDTDRLLIDSREDHRRVEEFVKTFQPHLRPRVAHYAGKEPLFDAMGIEPELRKVLERKIWLKSGGHLTIDHAEALVAIDVNTGRFVGKGNLEETVLKTNLEAVKEIARQIRLRNLGGIIVLDLIDMNEHKNREKVSRALEEALRPDKANTKILKISEFGLVEMTRKRTRESVLQQQTKACPCCEGKGFVKDPVAVCHEIFRELLRLAPQAREKRLEVRAHADVITLLLDAKRATLEEIEEITKKKVTAKVEAGFHQEKFEVVPLTARGRTQSPGASLRSRKKGHSLQSRSRAAIVQRGAPSHEGPGDRPAGAPEVRPRRAGLGGVGAVAAAAQRLPAGAAPGGLVRLREPEAGAQAASRPVVDVDEAAVGLHDLARDRQPEPGPSADFFVVQNGS